MSKALKIHKPGFLLIEFLIAMAIMAVIWLVVARYQGSVILVTHNAQQRMKATSLAMRLLDSGQFDTKKKEIDDFVITWDRSTRPIITPSIFNQNQSSDIGQFDLVTVHVAWKHNGHMQSVQLTSGIVVKRNQS